MSYFATLIVCLLCLREATTLSLGNTADRRAALQQMLMLLPGGGSGVDSFSVAAGGAAKDQADNSGLPSSHGTLRVPLHYVPKLSAYVLYYTVGGREAFGAIVDTGSPFLMVPGYCDRQRWGCYRAVDSQSSGLKPTYERFESNQGWVDWRRAPFGFVQAEGSLNLGGSATPESLSLTFGVLSESLMDGSGGVFLGLIRDTDRWIRPSFLGQTNVRSLQIDLTASKSLMLSTGPGVTLISNGEDRVEADAAEYFSLIRDLQRYGDPVVHYTAKAISLTANGQELATDGHPIYVIFDTGVSGMVVSRELFDERYTTARQRREKSLWGEVEVGIQTRSGTVRTLTATNPVTTPLGERPWPKFKNAHLVVIGLSFLEDHCLTIDIDEKKLWFQ
jgi:hypothetical protein